MHKPTILIVDDDHVSLTLISKLVEKLSYSVIQAEDGLEATHLMKTKQVDLIVADYDMPNMSGLELLKGVKMEYPRLPFILVTAYSNLKVIREAWENGAFDFFQKPVFVDRLNQTIRLAVEFGHLSIARRKFPQFEEMNPDSDLLNLGVLRELAVALDKIDLSNVVEEFETHARIELEQIFRFSVAGHFEQVRALSHRMAGTALNLGLNKLSDHLRAIEMRPNAPIASPAELEQILEKSIFWLNSCLSQILTQISA